MRSLHFLVLGPTALALLTACTVQSNDDVQVVRMVPVALDGLELEEHPRVSLIAAFELTSQDTRFGGLSGLRFLGDELILATDRGSLWRARASFDPLDGLTGLDDWQVRELKPGETFDIEALEHVGERRLILSTERQHGLHEIDDLDGALSIRALGDLPPPLDDLPFNRGIESVAMIGGDLLLLSEGEARDGEPGLMPGLVLDQQERVKVRFSYQPSDGYAPTDAVAHEGDLIIVERSASILGGFQTRLVRVSQDRISDGEIVSGEPIWQLRHSPLADNFEGIDVRTVRGTTRFYLVSDDNFSRYQRSLLLELRLESELTKPAP